MRIEPHILKLLRLYVGLFRKMLRTLSGIILEMSWRWRRHFWCSVPGRVFVKLVKPEK